MNCDDLVAYVNRAYHVRELQTAANPITTVAITKSTLLKLDSNVGCVWFFAPSLGKLLETETTQNFNFNNFQSINKPTKNF